MLCFRVAGRIPLHQVRVCLPRESSSQEMQAVEYALSDWFIEADAAMDEDPLCTICLAIFYRINSCVN
jgi:hypothetical protein